MSAHYLIVKPWESDVDPDDLLEIEHPADCPTIVRYEGDGEHPDVGRVLVVGVGEVLGQAVLGDAGGMMPRTPEQEAAAALHRDADGNGLLAGPDCPDCERRAVVHYRCVVCSATFDVPGVYRWYWQGLGHWHDPDDPDGWQATMTDHRREHGDRGGFVPVR